MSDELRQLRERIFELETANVRLEKAVQESIVAVEEGRPLGIVMRTLRSGLPSFVPRWTPPTIVAKAQEWNRRHGAPPSAMDWNPTLAKRQKAQEKIERFYEDEWPSFASVRRHFDTWNSMIAAAGFDPREQGANDASYASTPTPEGDQWAHLPVWTGWQLVRPLRERLGITQHRLSTASGLNNTYLRAIEQGKQSNPSIRVVLALSRALGVGPRALMEVAAGDPDQPRPVPAE